MSLTKYEIKNILGNWFTIAWGLIFPIFMMQLIPRTFLSDIPQQYQSQALTGIFIGFSLMISLSIVYIGFSSSLSQELEFNMLERIRLFGYHTNQIMKAKMVAQFVFLVASLIIYTIISFVTYPLTVPTLKGALIYIASILSLSVILFILSFAIANLVKKTGPTYGITMLTYFIILIISGLMGIEVNRFPEPVQFIAKLFPTYYIGNNFYDVWVSNPYNFAPLIQSLIGSFSVSALLLLWSFHKDKRTLG